MKKILVALGIFTLGSVLQLILGTVYLFQDVAPLTQLCVLSSFLVMSALGLSFLEQLEKSPKVTEGLTDNFRMLLFHCGRFATALITLCTANVLAVTISYLYTIPFWVQANLMLGMVLVLIAAVVVVFLILRAGRPKKPVEKESVQVAEQPESTIIENNTEA